MGVLPSRQHYYPNLPKDVLCSFSDGESSCKNIPGLPECDCKEPLGECEGSDGTNLHSKVNAGTMKSCEDCKFVQSDLSPFSWVSEKFVLEKLVLEGLSIYSPGCSPGGINPGDNP